MANVSARQKGEIKPMTIDGKMPVKLGRRLNHCCYLTIVLGTLLLSSPVLSGCGPKATIGGYREVLEYYHGGHIDKLVADWGAPKGKHVYADGRQEYLFLKEYRQDYVDTPFYPSIGLGYHHRHFGIGGAFYPRTAYNSYSFCETRVVTDKRGNINEYYFRGDACRAIPSEPQR